MNTRTSGVIIAVSAAVAGSLVPSTVHAYLDNLFIIALGLGAIVALNAGIALLHIIDRGRPAQRLDTEAKASHKSSEPAAPSQRNTLAPSNVSVHPRRGRVTGPEPRPETEAASLVPPTP